MIKIILSDIDGTFLKVDKSTPELHAKAIKAVIDKGLKFVFVSARMPEAIYRHGSYARYQLQRRACAYGG